MPHQNQEKFTVLRDKSFTAWEGAIRDTESAIDRARQNLRDLKSALRVFKERRDSGEPWPGASGSAEEGFGSNETFRAKPRRRILGEQCILDYQFALNRY